MSESARTAVILLNWNSLDYTAACLESLERSDGAPILYVIDNGSEDGSAGELARRFPEVTVHEAGENLGFVEGNNLGLELARQRGAELALLLNNDTEVAPDAIALLTAALRSRPEAAAVGPSIYFHHRPEVLWSAGGRMDWRSGDTTMIGLDETDQGQFGAEPRPVDFLSGCALLVRLAVVDQIGALDPRFFVYYEEVEWCTRARRAGWELLHVPAARIWHKITAEDRQISPAVLYYMTRNRLLFLEAAGIGPIGRARAVLESARTVLSWSLRPRWRERRGLRGVVLLAVADYLRGRLGRSDAMLDRSRWRRTSSSE